MFIFLPTPELPKVGGPKVHFNEDIWKILKAPNASQSQKVGLIKMKNYFKTEWTMYPYTFQNINRKGRVWMADWQKYIHV